MTTEEKIDMCIYCGADAGVTRDHVPSKNIFGKPRPNDLVTVPACHKCNDSFKLDDEYFRQKITLGIDPQKYAIALEAIHKLHDPKKLGFAKKMLSDRIPGSEYMNVDRNRVERVARRIVRGLFFHHTHERLPKSTDVKVWFPCFDDALPDDPDLAGLLEKLAAEHAHQIGGSLFTYRALLDCDAPEASLWRLCFYEKNEVIAITTSQSKRSADLRR